MDPAIHKCNIDWLVGENAPVTSYQPEEGYRKTEFTMPDGMGSGLFEILPLNLGMQISRGMHLFSPEASGKMVPFFRISSSSDEPFLVVQSCRKGKVLLHEHQVQSDLLMDGNKSAFHHVRHLDFTPVLDAHCNITVIVLKVSDAALTQLIGSNIADRLFEGLKITKVPSAQLFSVPYYISSLFHESLFRELTGEMQILHAQTRILDYLCALAKHVTVDQRQDPEIIKKTAISQLHRSLVRLEGKIPPLHELAGRYGLSVKAMTETFKEVYGKPICAYITECRLDQAHIALRESNIPIKMLAQRLGYSHVNHFITAFTRRFGQSPGNARKSQKYPQLDKPR